MAFVYTQADGSKIHNDRVVSRLLNRLESSTAGAATASKALVLDANSQIDTISFNGSGSTHCIDASDGMTIKFIETGTYQSTAGGGITLSATNTRPVAFLFDDNGAALSGDNRATLSRVLLTYDQGASTINALRGQIKMLDGIDITSASAVVSPITAYFELAGTGARTLSGHVGAVRAAIEEGASGTTTIAASSYYAGFEATLNSTRTYTTTGDMAAFMANISGGTSQWPIGLFFASGACDKGIYMTNEEQGIYSNVSGLNAAVDGHDFYVTVSAPNNQYGMSGYFDATINGTVAGHCYGLGSWINTGASSPVLSAGKLIVPLECGIYTGEAQSNARVVLHQLQAILNGAPNSLHVWRVNTTQTITAVIAAANPGSVGYASGAGTTSTKCGDIPIADVVGTGVVYVRCYNAAG